MWKAQERGGVKRRRFNRLASERPWWTLGNYFPVVREQTHMGFRIACVFVHCTEDIATNQGRNFGALCVSSPRYFLTFPFLDYSILHYYICCRGAEE